MALVAAGRVAVHMFPLVVVALVSRCVGGKSFGRRDQASLWMLPLEVQGGVRGWAVRLKSCLTSGLFPVRPLSLGVFRPEIRTPYSQTEQLAQGWKVAVVFYF